MIFCMIRFGTWECPTADMSGDNSGCIGKIGDYIILAQKTNAYANCNSLWIIDVSDSSTPTLAAVYTDTVFSDTFSSIRWFTCKEVDAINLKTAYAIGKREVTGD